MATSTSGPRALLNAAAQDRVILSDGSLVNHEGKTVWAILSDETANLTTDARHVVGKTSLEFDKANAAGTTKLAGVVNVNEEFNLSRFLGSDVIQALFYISDKTNLAEVNIRLGTDASNYNEWTLDDDSITQAVWQALSMRLDACEFTVVGNGWDPSKVTYIAFIAEFDSEANELADILLDHIVVKSIVAAS